MDTSIGKLQKMVQKQNINYIVSDVSPFFQQNHPLLSSAYYTNFEYMEILISQ